MPVVWVAPSKASPCREVTEPNPAPWHGNSGQLAELPESQVDGSVQSKVIECSVLPGLMSTQKSSPLVYATQLWKILKEIRIPGHLTCPLRNLYAGQEATVRTGHGTTDWFQIGKRVRQGRAVYCHPAYLTYMQRTS